MIYLLLSLLCVAIHAGFIHTKQGVMPNITILFDQENPVASHPDMMSYIQQVYDRNVRRGLENPTTLSTIDKQVILDLHNKIRSETARGLYDGPDGTYQPQACNMNALSWSEALEEVATDWSSRCQFEHSNDCQSRLQSAVDNGAAIEWNKNPTDICGENLYISGATPAMNVVYWNSEKNYGILGGIEDGWSKEESLIYTYQDKYYYPSAHYTQVVWANTRYVGCGFSECDGVSSNDEEYPWAKLLFTCNYYPEGNYNMYPYDNGAACSCCDRDRTVCTHDGGLCGGGWSSNYNNYAATDIFTVDRCYDGLGRNVCQDNDQHNPASDATPTPTISPSPHPSFMPSHYPSMAPSITYIANPTMSPGSDGEIEVMYAIRVSTEIIWLTYENDYDAVQQTIEELMFEDLAEPYLGLKSVYVDKTTSSSRGPYCAVPNCRYIYGFNTVPFVLEGATLIQQQDIVSTVNDGSYAEDLCDRVTAYYKNGNDKGLRCYRVTATVASITESEYQKFIGVTNDDDAPFDALNVLSYSPADIFVLLVFLGMICCCCWCSGWYYHKKRFQRELQDALNNASMYNPRVHHAKLQRQMAANSDPDIFERGLIGIGKFNN